MQTMQDVDAVMEKWRQTKERAEQHDFPYILYWDMRFELLYKDLKRQWNDRHAALFIKGVEKITQQLGYV